MLRLLIFIVIIAIVAMGFAWIADHPGEVIFDWFGQHVEMPAWLAILAIIALSVLLTLTFFFTSKSWSGPRRFSNWNKHRREVKGVKVLTRGILAAEAGDMPRARRSFHEAERLTPHHPLTLFLRSKVAHQDENFTVAQATYQKMLAYPETHLLGLKGLHSEALRCEDDKTAYEYAKKAQSMAHPPWAGEAVIKHYANQSRWGQALRTVDANARAKIITTTQAARQRAVLKTAMALELEHTNPRLALQLALEIARMAPDLTPAVALAAHLLTTRRSWKKAARLIEQVWKNYPHPDLAMIYLDIKPNLSPQMRFERAKTLAALMPNHSESLLMLAEAATAAGATTTARQILKPLIAENEQPFVRLCLLMAEIEEIDNKESSLAKDWLAQASRAKPDPLWIADGLATRIWAPVSPITGQIDAYKWATPPQDGLAPRFTALSEQNTPISISSVDHQIKISSPPQDKISHHPTASQGGVAYTNGATSHNKDGAVVHTASLNAPENVAELQDAQLSLH